MKILNTINDSVKKFVKGMFGLLMINILLFASFMIIQSCQNDNELIETQEQKLSLEKFEFLAKETNIKIQQDLSFNSGNNLQQKSNTENEAKELLNPLISESKNLLISYGFTEDEIIEEFGSFDSPEVIYMSFAIAGLSKQANSENIQLASVIPSMLFIESSYASSSGDIYNCALRALGVEALWDLYRGRVVSSYAARKALIKAVGKAAARLGLGFVGVAWAVGDFVACMW